MSYSYDAMDDLFGSAGSPALLKVTLHFISLWNIKHSVNYSELTTS